MKTIEQWKPVVGYEGLYEVSNLGRVKSLNYRRTGRDMILKPGKDNHGYLQVRLCRNGKYKMFYVHRLVATAFIPNPKGFEQINHRDENKSNNRVSNLEWCNAKYNNSYGTRIERVSKTVEASKYSDFREICLRFDSTHEAGRNGYCNQAVSACCRGCYSTYRGNFYKNLYWRYADESKNVIMQERQIAIFSNIVNKYKQKCLI